MPLFQPVQLILQDVKQLKISRNKYSFFMLISSLKMPTSANSFIIVRSLSLAVLGFHEIPPLLSIDRKVMFQSPPTVSLSVSVLLFSLIIRDIDIA